MCESASIVCASVRAEHRRDGLWSLICSANSYLPRRSRARGLRAARSAVTGRVNFGLSHSNKLQLVAVQRYKGSSSGCLATAWPLRDQTVLLLPPHAKEGRFQTDFPFLLCVWLGGEWVSLFLFKSGRDVHSLIVSSSLSSARAALEAQQEEMWKQQHDGIREFTAATINRDWKCSAFLHNRWKDLS